jgi:ribosomal protein S4E
VAFSPPDRSKTLRSEQAFEFFSGIWVDTSLTMLAKQNALFNSQISSEETDSLKIVYVVTHGVKNIRFIDKDIHVNKNIMYIFETKKIVKRISFSAKSFTRASDVSNIKKAGTIIHISKLDRNFDLITFKNARGHILTIKINYVFVIRKNGKFDMTFPKATYSRNSYKRSPRMDWRMSSSDP